MSRVAGKCRFNSLTKYEVTCLLSLTPATSTRDPQELDTIKSNGICEYKNSFNTRDPRKLDTTVFTWFQILHDTFRPLSSIAKLSTKPVLGQMSVCVNWKMGSDRIGVRRRLYTA